MYFVVRTDVKYILQFISYKLFYVYFISQKILKNGLITVT